LVDDSVFPKGWEKHTAPLGGLSRLPERLQKKVDTAVGEAARQAALSASAAQREVEKEAKEKAKQQKADAALAREAVEARRETARLAKLAELALKEREANEEVLRQQVVVEVVAVDAGKQLVHVKRKNGKFEWLPRKEMTGDSLKLLKVFENASRESRLAKRVIGT
jgi:hypothetical protein